MGDSSIHAELELDVTVLEQWSRSQGVRVFPVLCRAVALGIHRNPEFNRIVRFGRIYQRASVDLFILSSTHTAAAEDELSGFNVRRAEESVLNDFVGKFERARDELKSGASAIQRCERPFRVLPGWLSRRVLNWLSFVLYDLNVWSPLSGLPRDAFGSVQISNVGSLGIDLTYSPIAPYTRIPLVISMGAICDAPVIDQGRICIRRRMRLGFVADHRLVEGKQIARLMDDFRRFSAHPDLLL